MEKNVATKASAKPERTEKTAATTEADNLLEELVAEDSRLQSVRTQARYSENGTDKSGDESVQIYRQRLRE